MIATRRTCLDPTELRQVLIGELSKDDFDSAISHLDACESCRAAAESIEQELPIQSADEDTPLIGSESDSIQNETACQIALQDMLLRSHAERVVAIEPPPFVSLGPYRLLELIGSGGMGAVYRAEHQRLKRQCAIKLLPPERVQQTGWLERFDREMTTIASLEHPNIVHATDAGHESGWHFLVMEHLDGLDVGRVANRMGRFDVPDACEIVRQAALGLAHIHDNGLVHRDIKPSNLMLTRSGAVKLLDLGLVLDGDDPLSKDDRLTTVGHVMGTMPYMAPEQLADSRDVRPQSDLYSLGATLYRLIAGHPPHRGGRGLASQVLAITSEDAKPLSTVRDDVSPEVVALVAKLLSRAPSKRPTSALVVAQQLESASKGHRLKRLVRDALRKQDSDPAPKSGLWPSVAAAGQGGSGRFWNRWFLGFAAAALLFVAGFVIKIATDQGELVIHSEESGLTMVVSQGEEVVDRLTVSKGTDNRTVLRKGTYRVEIEGGSDALVLSQNVVTINRGDEQTIDVSRETENSPVQIAGPGVISPSESEADNSASLAVQTDDSLPGDTSPLDASMTTDQDYTGMVAFPMLDVATFNGQPLKHWLKQIQTESDIERLGEATFAAVAALQEGKQRGLSGTSASQSVINALLVRARQFGGVHSKLPPLPGFSDATVNESEHFMWYLTKVFAEWDSSSWYEASVEELVHGNSNSRAAVIFCIHRNNIVPFHGTGGGMGGMGGGGMGGMLGMSGTLGTMISSAGQDYNSNQVRPKFTINRLIRCCVSLGSNAAWEDLSEQDQAKAAAMSREIAMTVPSLIGVQPWSLPELLDTLRAVPEDQRSEEETQVIETAGYIAAEKSNKTPEMMEAESQPAGSAIEAPADTTEQSSTTESLYQGRDLSNWMNALERERNLESLVEAMVAVEVLSRDEPAKLRLAAADATMQLARQLGGRWAGSADNQQMSAGFMSAMPNVFSLYMPDPGIQVATDELEQGNTKSKLAAIWVLRNFVNGAIGGVGSEDNKAITRQWGERAGESPEVCASVLSLVDLLKDTADEFQKTTDDKSSVAGLNTSQSAINVALHLLLLIDEDVSEHTEFRDIIGNRVQELLQRAESRGINPGDMLQMTAMSAAEVVSFIQITENDPMFASDAAWSLVAKSLSSLQYSVLSDRLPSVLEKMGEAKRDLLLTTIETMLSDPMSLQIGGSSAAHLTEYYATHEGSIEKLEAAQANVLAGLKLYPYLPDGIAEPLKQAIEKAKAVPETE